MVYRRKRGNRRQASPSELAGVTDRDRDPGNVHHGAVDFGLEQVGRAQSVVHVEAIHAEKKNVCVQAPQSLFRDRSHQREGILPQGTAGQNHLEGRTREFGGDIDGVRDDGQMLALAQSPCDRGGCGSGIKNDYLAFFHHASGGGANLRLFLPVQLFFLPQGRIFERAFSRWQGAAVGAVDSAMGLVNVQIFSNRDLRCAEMLGQVADQYTAVATQNLQDQSSSFFVQHRLTRKRLLSRICILPLTEQYNRK